MGVSPFGYVEGMEISQEDLTKHIKSLPALLPAKYICAHCRTGVSDKFPARCECCGSVTFVIQST